MGSEFAPPGILVPIDGSPLAEQAVPYAQALLAPGATLTLLAVLEPPDPTHGMWVRLLAPAVDEQDVLERLAHDDLKRAEGLLRGEQPPIGHEVVWGDPAAQIIRVAAERQVELIAMTTHGRGAMGRWIFGSVADRVARHATVPVLLVRPRTTPPPSTGIRRLVVPLDGSALAEEAIPLAQRLAARLDVPVHLITAFDAMASHRTWLGPVVAFDAETYQEILDQLDADADAFLARAGEQLTSAGVACTREVLHGSPFWTIANVVEEGDLIVMTSHGRSGVRRWLLGSVAEKLVRESPVPVILVPVAARQSAQSGSTPVAN